MSEDMIKTYEAEFFKGFTMYSIIKYYRLKLMHHCP